MRHFKLLLCTLTLLAISTTPIATQAAIVYSGDLDPANPNDWTVSTIAYIGYTDTTDPGEVEVNNGSDLRSKSAYLGYNSGTSGTMTVTGIGSTWNNFYYLTIGQSGSGTLSITGGGAVSNTNDCYIGRESNSTGIVTVDGTGSTWSNNSRLYIGNFGSGTLSITNGGIVNNNYGSGIGYDSGSTGIVTVDGAGSTWTTNSGYLAVGEKGDGTLLITNGGTVSNGTCYIGSSSGSTGIVTVDGAGSTLTNNGHLYVGFHGDGTLNIINGGTVNATGNTYVACDDESTGLINFGTNGNTLTTRSLIASSSNLFGTGTINIQSFISDLNVIFDSPSSFVQTLTIGGSGQDRNITVNLDMSSYVGDLGVGNGSITIQNGIEINSVNGYLGYWTGTAGVATVSGNGSAWDCSSYLYAGFSGNGSLSVTNGGTVHNRDGGYIGYNSDSTGVVTVDGAGSNWINNSHLYAGFHGGGTLNITNGGYVKNSSCYIGDHSGSTGVVTVDSTGAVWDNYGYFYAGFSGSGTISITGGGTVHNISDSYIGYNSGSTGIVTVDGVGSTCTNTRSFSIGNFGNGTLSITNGGIVSNNYEGYIGHKSGSIGVVTVDGAGSTWNNNRDLYVGFEGNGTLNITNGGAVNVTDYTYVAYNDGSTGSINFGTNGGTLTTQSLLASSAQLFGTGTINTNGIVSDYNLVFDSTSGLSQTFTIGGSGQDRNITVNLDMSGSVGDLGVSNGSITINGITVNSQDAYIGCHPGSTGVVTVSGTGSIWNNRPLYIGNYGSGTLSITNGGAVNDIISVIGLCPDSIGAVTVNGIGSTWTNSDELYVGYRGSGTLTITNGGNVSNSDGYIGNISNSANTVTVDGIGSTWTNTDDLYVGRYGSGTLTITNGGLVSVAGTLSIDYYNYGNSLINMSDGGMLALLGDADASLAAFFDLIDGTDAIQWWDPEVNGWNSLTSAVMGDDYTLEYFGTGDWNGYTILTVTATVPEPGSIALLLTLFAAGLGIVVKKRR